VRLAAAGQLPARHADRWRDEAERIRAFIETRCWSERRQSYVRFADGDDLDAALLLMAVGHAGWMAGAVLGLLHALFAGTTLVNVLLPAVHPRMGTPYSSARDAPLLEPPGFMLLNYGRATPAVTVLAHVAYGAIIGFLIGSAP
jgi:hypothetical protein